MATKLCKAIQFNSMMDELSKQEFIQLMTTIYDLNQTHLIKTSLFHYFIPSYSNTNDLDAINATISEIIQSRKDSKQILTTDNIDIKLHHLPSVLIGFTASYLSHTDYESFEQSNRSIFIGCNQPNKLNSLDLYDIGKSRSIHRSSFHLSKFPSLRTLTLEIDDFRRPELKMPSHQRYIINDLETLVLEGGFKGDIDIDPFITQTIINPTNINTLALCRFGNYDKGRWPFPSHKIYGILTMLPNLENIIFEYNTFPSSIDPKKLKALCPNLRGLSIIWSEELMRSTVTGLSSDLLYLSCDDTSIESNVNVDFCSLKELSVYSVTPNTIDDISKIAHSLNKLKLSLTGYSRNSPLTESSLADSICGMFKKCTSLEYIEFEVSDLEYCIAILNGIEAGLFATKTLLHRHRLKIKMVPVDDSEYNIDPMSVMQNIGRVIRLLERSNIEHFIFMWEGRVKMDNMHTARVVLKILNELKDISDDVEVMVKKHDNDQCYVVSNKHYPMNEWEEQFVLSDWY